MTDTRTSWLRPSIIFTASVLGLGGATISGFAGGYKAAQTNIRNEAGTDFSDCQIMLTKNSNFTQSPVKPLDQRKIVSAICAIATLKALNPGFYVFSDQPSP